jgi:hypothetical protein
MRRRNSSLTLLSVARMRSRRVVLLTRNCPRLLRSQMKVKPRKLKVSGSEPVMSSSFCGKAAELDQAGLVRIERQRELLEPLAHIVPEAPGVRLVLEADDNVISIPHEDHVARGLVPSPARGPEVEHVMQVDVGEQR